MVKIVDDKSHEDELIEEGLSKEEEKDIEMETGEKDEDIETPEGRKKLQEDDEIDAAEQGFMEGATGDGQGAKCRKCGVVLEEDFVEKEINREVMRFCSEKCLEEYEKERKDELE